MKQQITIARLGRPPPSTLPLNHSTNGSRVQLRLDFDQPAATQTVTAPLVSGSPTSRFAIRFAALLEADRSAGFDNAAVSQLAREIFGSSAGHARDAYDAAEAGFNIYLNRVGLDLQDTRAAMEWLHAEQARLPLQARRDQTQIEFQQFSTPPAEALVVLKAAALCAGMRVLEPSAGTGNIAILAHLAGASVDTNEIDPRRRELLLLQGFEPMALDAERLDNLLPTDKSYHAIVMNPPFSATGGRVRGHRTAFGARHVEQALLRLMPGGRLVAIVGQGMAMERPAFGRWWSDIGERYRVRANVGIDGRVYAKFGTTFDHQMIVIDHDGPTPNKSVIITANGLSVGAAYERLKDLSEEDVYGRVRKQTEKAGGTSAASAVSGGSRLGNGSDRGANRVSVEDGAGDVLWRASAPVTTPQWLTWHQLALNRQEEMVQTVTDVLERERTQLPTEVEAMREWAAWLLLSTLDRMGML